MSILAVCTGSAERLPGKSYKTGIFKHPVETPVMVDRQGLIGDAICNRKHHGGVDQAIYGMGSIDLDWWSAELGDSLVPGTFGENLVIEGVDSRSISVGDRFATGHILLEVTSTRIPCATFAARMRDPGFAKRFYKAARPGFYCRVLKEGSVQAGEAVTYAPFSGDRICMPEMLETYGRNLSGADRARYLAAPIHHKLRAKLSGG
ncbi:MOSC domain-containing protein [Pararhizobium antarcticum]|uniref:Molybdenum cofactor biosysynthesis protein n=1 Tax=Pararhizobium antarcticum TaxID=1798805 RepID=A0A657LPC8_9HYPH|nr:MOSC domain-containing protein [Pararhizobium antarcticum]OJF93982.1 molybdenum cofactor biosysynthesis protein [Rhizobium sp. 58]OJF94071.1 molybdenum cofactor biosysynthesis protein [Pararhizobium antarcticum]